MKLQCIPLSWCSAMWQCAIHSPGSDLEQQVDGLPGRDQHRVLRNQVGLGYVVLFEQPGSYALEHRSPGRAYPLATIEAAAPSLAEPSPSCDTTLTLLVLRSVCESVPARDLARRRR